MFKWLAKLIHGKHIGKHILLHDIELIITDVDLTTFEAKSLDEFCYCTINTGYELLPVYEAAYKVKEATDGTT